jgi:gamma-glutamylcyclotransferase (GGCT)/AIG2-like uncharacterized protein YtfP
MPMSLEVDSFYIPMPELLFSYGTLQKEKVQVELFGRKLSSTPDAITGYKLSTIEITDPEVLRKSELKYHFIAIPGDDSDRIDGVVIELNETELAIADDYEAEQYKRVEVKLASGKKSWVYVSR